jgi:twitching motility protein PilT
MKAGLPPIFRRDSRLFPYKDASHLTPEALGQTAQDLMSPAQREVFERDREIDIGYGIPGLGRFRLNVFQQRGTVGMVFRVIPTDIKSIRALNLPRMTEELAMERRGLILVTGTTGSGKSTTLASMMDFINQKKTCHIITIEDPIEFLHRDKKSIINQREVGYDTLSFAAALKSALRQDPDVVLVGEMRDFETIETALVAAETGHLVLSTLHTVDAAETVHRIISVFPPYQQKQIRLQLASILKGIISQRLVPRADNKGRVPAVEVMVATARVRECIEVPEKTKEIRQAIAEGFTTHGMQTFDQSLMGLLKRNLVTYKEALRQSSNPDDFALKMSGISSTSDARWSDFEKGDNETDLKIERF